MDVSEATLNPFNTSETFVWQMVPFSDRINSEAETTKYIFCKYVYVISRLIEICYMILGNNIVK